MITMAMTLSVAGIEFGSTLLWICVGIVCGILCAMFYGGRRMVLYDMLAGIVAALAGGWASTVMMGDATRQQFVIATLTALLCAGVALLLLNFLLRPRHR